MSALSITSTLTLRNGIKMPRFGLGVYEMSGQQCTKSVTWALEQGYRLIDSAEWYENEEESGAAIRKWVDSTPGASRSSIFYVSKLKSNRGYQATKSSIQESLDKCGLGYIDLYLIHSPHSGKQKRLESWKAMEEAVDSGVIRSIGVSNYGTKHIRELLDACRIKPCINQVDLHPFMTRTDIVKLCRDNDIHLMAWGPLVRGEKFDHPVIVSMSKKYGKSPAQILLRWGLQHDFITIPKSVSKDRIIQNSQVFDINIEPEDMKVMDALDEYFVTDWDPTKAD
ncbi:hypothetical protein PROFUN_06896 [Planoprotostelium fungivorum]|uniref:NADP-dependent oxidoreductase domain-containing protein n=1 Tax=Planoprotostelium fungivorum TaxID=1890364 RepID=A0A2P6NMV5_9EUKA|nr:hypothetical protein PROFUN_06896 [Planoprotostelium fungivorum]